MSRVVRIREGNGTVAVGFSEPFPKCQARIESKSSWRYGEVCNTTAKYHVDGKWYCYRHAPTMQEKRRKHLDVLQERYETQARYLIKLGMTLELATELRSLPKRGWNPLLDKIKDLLEVQDGQR